MNKSNKSKQTIHFGNKKALQITSNDLITKIKNLISDIGTFNIHGKYYNILNKKSINSLKSSKSYVSLRTYGKGFILFLTTIKSNKGDRKYCIFINKKNEMMIISKFKFNEELFDGTLFDGELVKNSKGEWIYFIDDIAYYKGQSMITENFRNRYTLIKSLICDEYIEDIDLSVCKIEYKRYHLLNNIEYLYNLQKSELNYRCGGLYFKNNNNFSDNYLYPFPECRSDYKVNQMKNNGSLKLNTSSMNFSNQMQIASPMSSEISVSPKFSDTLRGQNAEDTQQKIISNNCSFEIRITNLPDIYELYAYNNSNILEKISYASVQDLKTSNFCKELLKGKDKEMVECSYNKQFKKWKPIKQSKTIDNIQTINIIQNI